jgi:transcriptional regulator with XRE-family HTH domain
MHGIAGVANELTSQPALGQALKRARLERGHSLSAVAKGTGISTSFLSVVENGRSDITIGRLIQILRFYEMRLDDLFPEIASVDRIVVAPHERQRMVMTADGIEVYLLAPDTRRRMMPVLGIHQPGSCIDDLEGHDGEVFVHMLEGSLLFEREGHDPFLIRAGSSAYYPGRPAPRITNVADEVAVLIAVVSPPTM